MGRNALSSSVVGSASIWVLGRVAGPTRTATVIHADENAVHLDFEGTCLSVLAARAIQIPCGVRTMMPQLPDVEIGAEAPIHDGIIQVPGLQVLVTNIVDTTVPVLSPAVTAWAQEHFPAAAGSSLDEARNLLDDDALTALEKGDATGALELIGAGPGLTPLGDDVLAGWLATAVANRHPHLPEMRSAVALSAFERTNLVSATLLACAARGEGIPEFRSLLSGVQMQNEAVIAQSLELLIDIAKTSGVGLVIGSLMAFASHPGD